MTVNEMDEGAKYCSQGRPPEVSVLTSCYNISRWLHQAIDSVLAQTFDNFEFILVDDGSTDETWNILQRYHERDERIVAIHKKNTGLTDSLNVGIEHAKGTWIARLDADDQCEPTRLEEQVKFIRNQPDVMLLGTGFIEIDEQDYVIKKHLYPADHNKLVQHLEHLRRFFPHSSAFFRREIAIGAGGYNPLFRKSQDHDLWLRLAQCGRIACLADCLVTVRIHPEQISSSAVGTAQLVYGAAASVCHFLRIHGGTDPSASKDERAWQNFIAWVERRMMEEGALERYKAWANARSEFFTRKSRLAGMCLFSMRLLKSGHAHMLFYEKVIGSFLPKRLAKEWMKRSCAAS